MRRKHSPPSVTRRTLLKTSVGTAGALGLGLSIAPEALARRHGQRSRHRASNAR
jgi:hypothetical protein